MVSSGEGVVDENEEVDTTMEDAEERRVLHAALDSFRQYRRAAHYNITHLRRQSFYSLPSAHMELLSEAPFSLPDTFDAIDDAIDSNADLAEAILAAGLPAFGIDPNDESWHGQATPGDMDKARSTLRQFYRDWSAEGIDERSACYAPILRELISEPGGRALVPGAGLGRLVIALCAAGFEVEGNEISYHQLLASNYILNYTTSAGQHKLYPWALNFSNHVRRENQLACVMIPDIHPDTELAAASDRLSMTAGDFCELYRRDEYADTFDVVATCFFIDTAPNVINYINTIKHCLKPGGKWINLGPLLWHFEAAPTPAERERQRGRGGPEMDGGIGEPGSFELSDDEVQVLVQRLGFDMAARRQTAVGPTGYIQDPASMLQNSYRPSFWIAKKR